MIYSRALRSLLSRRFSHADTASSGTRFLFPSRGPRFRPRSSSRDWIYYLQFLDHSPTATPLFPLPPFPPSRLRFRCTRRRTHGSVSRIYWPFRSPTPHYYTTNRFSTLFVFLLPFHPFCPFFLSRCSAISRLYLLTDSFAITRPWHSYRLFQSSRPNVGSMTFACTG